MEYCLFLFYCLFFLWFFKAEVFHFLVNLTFLQWVLILGGFCVCLFFAKDKIKYFVISSVKKLRYFSPKKYRIKLLRSIQEKNAEEKGEILAAWLKNNLSINFGLMMLSMVVFSHYPLKMLNMVSAAILMFTLIAYFFVSLAFEKRALITFVGTYSLVPVAFYPFAFISDYTGINLFETLPADVINFLNLNVYNLIETANKLFFYCSWMCFYSSLCHFIFSLYQEYSNVVF